MNNFNDKLNKLFDEWIKKYGDKQILFCWDGLLEKFNSNIDVDEEWSKMERRVLFVLQDNPDGERDGCGHDIRTWFENPIFRNLKDNFSRTLGKLFYSILNLQSNEECREVINYSTEKYNELIAEEVKRTFNTQVFAILEAKKLAGSKDRRSYKELINVMEDDKKYIRKELQILRANIIVCCDPYDSQYNFFTKNFYAGEDRIVCDKNGKYFGCYCYDSSKKVVLLKSYHPSNRRSLDTFQRVVSTFHAFLKDMKARGVKMPLDRI